MEKKYSKSITKQTSSLNKFFLSTLQIDWHNYIEMKWALKLCNFERLSISKNMICKPQGAVL